MSAFLVHHDHIDALLAGYAKAKTRSYCERPTVAHLTELGQLLLIENSRSVAWRYNEAIDEDWRNYRFDVTTPVQPMVNILKLCDCLEYQSCERDDYMESDAYKQLNRIRGLLISALPGYENAPWAFVKKEAA
jgi:hypothetical protein